MNKTDVNPVLEYKRPETVQRAEAESLRELTPQQWKSGIAAWLGWLFDGLDMHLYMLVAAPYVAGLMHLSASDNEVKRKISFIQAAFLIGWALGGGFFGRIGDLLGRSKALALTILTYATFTGLQAVAWNWESLLVFRFLAALGIGGEWSVGSSLLSETWPRKWRAWIAAVLQTGVNLGVLVATATGYLLADKHRVLFLIGVIPALLVFWIRRAVPEPEEWHTAKKEAGSDTPGVIELFRGTVLRTTVLTIIVCSFSLTAWWAFMFWGLQYLRAIVRTAGWAVKDQDKLVNVVFWLINAAAIVGNFFAAWLARLVGYKYAILLLCVAFVGAMVGTYSDVRGYESLRLWMPLVGFCSGVFGLFTMYLPPLFPTLLRTTGAGFCYNIGRIAAAAGTVYFAYYADKFKGVDGVRLTLFYDSFVFIPAILVAFFLPVLKDVERGNDESV